MSKLFLVSVTKKLDHLKYPAMGHMAGLDGAVRGDRKKLLMMAGY